MDRSKCQRHRQCDQRWHVVLRLRGLLPPHQSRPRYEPCRHVVPLYDQGHHRRHSGSPDRSMDRPSRPRTDLAPVGSFSRSRLRSAQPDPRLRHVPRSHCAHHRRHAGVRPLDHRGRDPLGPAASVIGGVDLAYGVHPRSGRHSTAPRPRRGDGRLARDSTDPRGRALRHRGSDIPLPPKRAVGDGPRLRPLDATRLDPGRRQRGDAWWSTTQPRFRRGRALVVDGQQG